MLEQEINAKSEKRNEKLQESQLLIQESIDKKYYEIKDCFDRLDHNDLTIIQTFQSIAADLEEFFRLSYDDPSFQISCICEYIIKACRTRGFTENQCDYVYDAFDPPQYRKYKRLLDLSSVTSTENSRKRKEDSLLRFNLFKKKINEAKKLIVEIGSMEREDHQEAMDLALDLVDDYNKLLELHNIPIARLKQQDLYESGKDDSKNQIRYPPTLPAKTNLSKACEDHGKAWLKVAKIVENEGVIDPESGFTMLTDDDINRMAEAIEVYTELLDPVLDRKWRMDHLHWYEIITIANKWFKHTGATASKQKTFDGLYRSITREHVGARKENMPPFFNKVVALSPHFFLFFSLFMNKVRLPRGAKFSINLSPKLSEQSMR